MSLDAQISQLLTCPCCQQAVIAKDNHYYCINNNCQKSFPIIEQVPILINEKNSIFTIKNYVKKQKTTIDTSKKSQLINNIFRLVPKISANLCSQKNYQKFEQALFQLSASPRILIVGSGEIGKGLEQIINNYKITVVETDVYFSSRVQIIADGHDLPFQSQSFDGVICQAVLEHVINPSRCVAEIYRVLKPDGLIYAETPFMQQVHLKAYDFTRFTLSGHRYLWRNFQELESGLVAAGGTVLAWSILYFFLSFSSSKIYRGLCKVTIPFFIFWLKYFDYLLINSPASADSASCCFFLGKRSDKPISDHEIVTKHWTQQTPLS
jgi:SAM-dependent methyltransferase/uncharacterized protein YbaR (Trm112 family)